MTTATTMSGQPLFVPNTPSAASITAALPIMSFRVHRLREWSTFKSRCLVSVILTRVDHLCLQHALLHYR